ncbi:hypothetical protein KAK06_04765 [Ideonella sp. 4Y11]|uniref:Uncharacterized protein n=1 Tax=Ideonella aquatica TaxID=2824119 RepID=A0A941BPP2_9BURK|nr:hypothetical protein [Ideonella aquatica]MBQ0958260.1 hypothetical protein [Ideonella aquatica]
MSDRFDLEFQRLFGLDRAGSLIDFRGHTRALVLEWPAPADWERLGAVWRGVQDALGWPAPAIAVSGEALQLWFSLAEPVDAATAQTLLAALRERFLPASQAAQVGGWPRDGQAAPRPGAALPGEDRWSAFVAPDLAPLFAQTPWLDVPPGDDGQATLLAGLGSVSADRLTPLQPTAQPAATPVTAVAAATDPRAFLLQVMNDPAVPLALRIEAAKALLPR